MKKKKTITTVANRPKADAITASPASGQTQMVASATAGADARQADAAGKNLRWDFGSLLLHSGHAILLAIALFLHPVLETRSSGALP